jgi:hypothetical protein
MRNFQEDEDIVNRSSDENEELGQGLAFNERMDESPITQNK